MFDFPKLSVMLYIGNILKSHLLSLDHPLKIVYMNFRIYIIKS